MNKELAINLLRGSVLGTNEQLHEAVFMAIKALKAESVKHGRWIDDEDTTYANCSECGWQIDTHYERGYLNYCPNCGAKMDGRENG
jgi:Zn finger protein HypA/HybF involved in hydrogenase expression